MGLRSCSNQYLARASFLFITANPNKINSSYKIGFVPNAAGSRTRNNRVLERIISTEIFHSEENEMRILSIPLLVSLLCAGSAAHAQTRQFNLNCGLLGSFAQHREHYQHCKTTEPSRITNVVPSQSPKKCGPQVSRELSGAARSSSSGLGNSAPSIGGLL
jgi:hypothetical protein